MEWFWRLVRICEGDLRRSQTPPTHAKHLPVCPTGPPSGTALGLAVAGLLTGTAEVAVTAQWELWDSSLVHGSGNAQRLTPPCADGCYHANGPCRLACAVRASSDLRRPGARASNTEWAVGTTVAMSTRRHGPSDIAARTHEMAVGTARSVAVPVHSLGTMMLIESTRHVLQ